jgi:hypothetical protein
MAVGRGDQDHLLVKEDVFRLDAYELRGTHAGRPFS